MVKISAAIKAHRYLALLAGFASFGILAGATLGLSRRARHQQTIAPSAAITVTSKTPAVQVLASEKSILGNSSVLVIRLKNVSGKDIKALTISIDKTWVTRSFFLGEETIAPNSIADQRIPLSADANQDINISSAKGREIAIAAVFFANGTGDGDPRYVQMLANQYAGLRDQAKRVLPKLRRLSDEPAQEQALADLEAEALALPTKGTGLVSPDFEDGLENARRTLLTRLGEIKEQRRSNRLDEALIKQEKLRRVFESLAGSPSN